jgi:putative ABC transport system permease protein
MNKRILSILLTGLLLYGCGETVLEPLLGRVLDSMYWFYDYHFTILPVLFTVLVFVILGVLIPMALYGQTAKQSVVEQLMEAE